MVMETTQADQKTNHEQGSLSDTSDKKITPNVLSNYSFE